MMALRVQRPRIVYIVRRSIFGGTWWVPINRWTRPLITLLDREYQR